MTIKASQLIVTPLLLRNSEGVIISRQSDGVFPALQDGNWKHREFNYLYKNHLYIYDPARIPDYRDWAVDTELDRVVPIVIRDPENKSVLRKIIATTDQQLIADGVNRISEDFLKQYVLAQGEGTFFCELEEYDIVYTSSGGQTQEKL